MDDTQPKREAALFDLRSLVKRSRWTYGNIAQSAGVSARWVGEVMRGNYPYRGACRLPKNIRVAVEQMGFAVDEIITTY